MMSTPRPVEYMQTSKLRGTQKILRYPLLLVILTTVAVELLGYLLLRILVHVSCISLAATTSTARLL